MFNFFKKGKSHDFDFGRIGTDIHSHLIPGVDDGSPDMDTSINLIRGMSELGYRKLITTPHILQDMYPNNKEDLQERFEILLKKVKEENIQIELKLAAEYFLDENVKELLKEKNSLLTLKDKMVLVEFSMASEPIDLKEILFEMELQGYVPVIAHPERYVYHERNISFFEILKSSGCLFQLNILSLAGFYGKSPHSLSHHFIKQGFYDLVGTDLHNERHLKALRDAAFENELSRLLDSGKVLNPEF